MSEIEITYRFTRAETLASLTIKSHYVPRIGEAVHLVGFTSFMADELFEYSGIVRHVNWSIRPHKTGVVVILD